MSFFLIYLVVINCFQPTEFILGFFFQKISHFTPPPPLGDTITIVFAEDTNQPDVTSPEILLSFSQSIGTYTAAWESGRGGGGGGQEK